MMVATIYGDNNANTKYGTVYNDLIYGRGGNDSLYGRTGDDQILGETGNDSLWGEDGADILKGGDGADFLYGGNNSDVLWGGIGDDRLYGDGGSDTLKAEAGNDVLKGGTGILYAYSGDGNDTIVYDPTTDNLAKFGQYLSGSILNGDSGTDTLQIFNRSVYTDGTSTKPAQTNIVVDSLGSFGIRFQAQGHPDWEEPVSYVGLAKGIEKITVTGSGGLNFNSDYHHATGKDVTGTTVSDTFHSGDSGDIMRGGGGNDTFYFGGGTDVVYSEANDADTFWFDTYFNAYSGGQATAKGFNGEGSLTGDKIHIPSYMSPDDNEMVVEYTNGNTVFHMREYPQDYIVEGVDLRQGEGIDWFLG
jgi:hypothetical protein